MTDDALLIAAALAAVAGSVWSFVLGFHAGARTIHELCTVRKVSAMRLLHLTAAGCLVLGGLVGAAFWSAVTEPLAPCPECAPAAAADAAAGGQGGGAVCRDAAAGNGGE